MTRAEKIIIGALLCLFPLGASYKAFEYWQRLNDIKFVLAQSKVVDVSTLSSYGFVDPIFREIYKNDSFYFNLDSCCSEQQFGKASRTFYKAGAITKDGQTYDEWGGILIGNYLPLHLAQGSFGDAEVKIQGKPYIFTVVNETQAKKTTIIITPSR
ncbi:hypothetical protein EON83_26390 [bacterium]|nr:MAG: hypothetical protein EON83_26390 [bacterium]